MTPIHQADNAGRANRLDDNDRIQPATGSCATLHWNDVHQAAKDLFAVWMNRAELRWAETCWTLLTQAGLTRYHSELDRCRADLHLLALADLYHDFCFLAWDEDSRADLGRGAQSLQISPFRIGQLVGADEDAGDEKDDESAVAHALRRLVAADRQPVLKALLRGFQGANGLFDTLFHANTPIHKPYLQLNLFEEDEVELLRAERAGNVAHRGQLRAYDWLVAGSHVNID